MKIISKHTVVCCNCEKTFNEKYSAMEFLFRHIRQYHKKLFSQLDKQGMKLARSQNGCGYYDPIDGSGWREAKRENLTFVRAWITQALEDKLDKEANENK